MDLNFHELNVSANFIEDLLSKTCNFYRAKLSLDRMLHLKAFLSLFFYLILFLSQCFSNFFTLFIKLTMFNVYGEILCKKKKKNCSNYSHFSSFHTCIQSSNSLSFNTNFISAISCIKIKYVKHGYKCN